MEIIAFPLRYSPGVVIGCLCTDALSPEPKAVGQSVNEDAHFELPVQLWMELSKNDTAQR